MLTGTRTVRNWFGLIFLTFICVAWNTVHAQSATNSDHQPSTETPYRIARPAFDQATTYIYEKVEQFQNRWASGSNSHPNPQQDNAKAHPSQQHTRTEIEAQQGVGRVQNQFDRSHPSSHRSRESLIFACEAAHDVWRMLNPSTQSFAERDVQTNDDFVAVDEALERIRGIIHILGRTHNALLEEKLANRPFFQKLWYKYLLIYKDPYFPQNKDGPNAKLRKAFADMARSTKDFAAYSRNSNSDAIKKSINDFMGIFGKELSHSTSTLKRALQKAARKGLSMMPDVHVHPYVEDVARSFSALSKKWLHKMGRLVKAAKPLSGRMPSHKHMRRLIKELEDMTTEFKEEVWRSRTEWVYQRGEALSLVKDAFHDLKRRATHESGRAFENLNLYVRSVNHILKGNWERGKEVFVTLRLRVVELTEQLIILLQRWIIPMTRFLGNYRRLFTLYASNLWRIFAFIVAIVLFRFLLGFIVADDYIRSVFAGVFSRSNANNTTDQGLETTADGQHKIRPSDSPLQSETSESGPNRKSPSPERRSPPNTSKPSRIRGATSPEHNKPVKPLVQRRERRPVSRPGNNDRTQRQTTPIQTSNQHRQNTLTSLEKRMSGRPIHLGDHEVQLVYEEAPRDDVIVVQTHDEGRKRPSAATKKTGPQRTSRRGEKQPGVKARTENTDDVITVNSSDESATSYGSASSRLTRGSLRRASARKNQAR